MTIKFFASAIRVFHIWPGIFYYWVASGGAPFCFRQPSQQQVKVVNANYYSVF